MSTEPPIHASSRFLDLQLGRFHVLDWQPDAPADQPVVLMLHGLMQTGHSYDEVAPHIASRGLRVVAVDLRGHGKSPWAPDGDYSREAMVGDLEQIVEALGLRSPSAPPFVIAGMSMGSAAPSVFAARHAGRTLPNLRALVLTEWAPWPEDAHGVGQVNDFIRKLLVVVQRSWPTFDAAVEEMAWFNPRRSKDNIRTRLSHALRERDDGTWAWATDPAHVDSESVRQRAAEPPAVMWKVISEIPCPCLVLRGETSDYWTREHAERLARTLPHGRLVEVAGAGHSVPGDNPNGFLTAVMPFLEQHLRSASS